MKFFKKLKNTIGKSFLGIDIGSYSVKIVELSKFGNKIKLENYALLSASSINKKNFGQVEKNSFTLAINDIAEAIKLILSESKILTKKSFFSIPDFLSFFTVLELPPISPKEIPELIKVEAEKKFAFPMKEMNLDWKVVEGKISKEKGFKILLAAVPKNVLLEYQQIAQMCDLEFMGLEAEIFSLMRSLIFPRDKEKILGLIDLGEGSTGCSVIEKGILKLSQSIDFGGINFTEALMKNLNLELKMAEEIKKETGLLGEDEESKKIKAILLPYAEKLSTEIGKVFSRFSVEFKKDVDEIIATGGNSLLPGLIDYLRNFLKKPIKFVNILEDIFYPEILNEILSEISCLFPVALGSARKGFG